MSAVSSGAEVAEKQLTNGQKQMLFWACFLALIATAFGFIVRALLIDTWGRQFGLTATQQGEIFGVGLWPFAISIILFSLVIDRIGYGKAMVFAFVCHIASAIMTITATGYWSLYWATFIVALANGTVEAVINPVVATLYPREKTKWLNILHAGWPGGLVLGGLLALMMGPQMDWRYKVGLLLIPTVLYGLLMLGRKFPVSERVAAGVSYKEMLKEFGMVGAFVVCWLMIGEIVRVFGEALPFLAGFDPMLVGLVAAIPLALAFGATINFALGRPLFLVLMFIMIPLATTELGTDSWITSLMEPAMTELGMQAGWVLVYTSLIMMVLRFFAGPIVHRLSPLGLLAASAAIAMVGLLFLSKATGVTILLAATLYGVGKTFFWPTMLGVVAEQSPRGGALTLNAIAGVGMLGVGVVGAVFLGYIQDTSVDRHLQAQQPGIHQQVTTEKKWVFGSYPTLDQDVVGTLPEQDRAEIDHIGAIAKKDALSTVAIFPFIMLLGYLGLIAYFRSRGGYKAEVLVGHAAEDEKFTGGVEGPVEA
jgi:MFS family permease